MTSERPDEATTADGITVRIDWDITWTRPSQRDAHAEHVERGHRATVCDVPGSAIGIKPPVEVGTQVRWSWDVRPVSIDGIPEQDMPAAVALLVETGRAYRTWVGARRAKHDRTVQVLRAAADRFQAAKATRGYHERVTAMQDAARHRDLMIAYAIRDQIVSAAEIVEAAEVTEQHAAVLRQHVDEPFGARLYIDDAGFANRLGVGVSSLRAYKSRGRLPRPDLQLGGSDGWLLSTVEAYAQGRPGQGARTDRGA